MAKPHLALIATLALGMTACGTSRHDGSPDASDAAALVDGTGDASVADADAPYVEAPLNVFSIAPGRGDTGGGLEVRFRGAGLRGVVEVRFGGTPAAGWLTESDTVGVAITPPHPAGVVDIVVRDVAGAEVRLEAAFVFEQPVTITSIEPPKGSTRGGEPVRLTGSGFTADAVVTIGSRRALSVTLEGDGSLTALTPEGVAGLADVFVRGTEGLGFREGGFEYTAEPAPIPGAPEGIPRVVEVLPNSGPDAGGTALVVRGERFSPQTRVFIGPLEAASVQYVDATTLKATTPPGSPGMATVRAEQSGGEDALAQGFYFVAEPALDAISPPYGSIAGGTLVRVHGAGFVAGTTVSFGGKLARDVTVLGPTLLQARTLGGEPGRADVTLRVPGRPALIAKGLWLYFDPAAEDGFWGPPIDRNLDVTVYDRISGARVEGAMVIVGPLAATPVRGYSNGAGQVTFGRDALTGPVTVSANKDGFAVTSVVGVSASHVALGLDRIPQCSDIPDDIPCNPPPDQSASLDGSASGNFKGVKIPWGSCESAPTGPSGLCGACTTDADCGGRPCVDIPDQGRYCTVGCTGPADCPAGYGCYSLGGSVGLACVPSGGELRVYCDVTNPSTDSQDPIPYPGVLVGPDGRFQTPTRLGEYAVFCWSGIYADGKFTPERLGVARHRGAFANGDIVVADVQLTHVMRADVPVVLDRPSLGSVFSETVELRSFIDLGADGVLELPSRAALGRGALVPRLVASLTGDLADASYTFVAVASSSEVPEGYSVTIREHVTAVDSDRVLRLGDDGFELRPGFPTTVRSMTSVDGGLLAVGERGLITRNTGGDWWFVQPSGTTRTLHAVAAVAGGAAIAVGEAGLALHYDGLVWHPVPTVDESVALRGVWMASADRAWAVGGPRVLAFDGASWRAEAELSADVNAITGRADESGETLYLAGANGLIATRSPGADFDVLATGIPQELNALWTEPSGAVWAVGQSGVALRIDGSTVTAIPAPTPQTLRAVWGDSTGAIWVAGDFGTLLSWDGQTWTDRRVRDFRSTLYALGGTPENTWALGAHELVLGPMMGLPKQLKPAPNSSLLHEITWLADTTHPAQLVVATVGDQAGPCTACGFQFTIPYDQRSIYARGDTKALLYPDFTGIPGTREPAMGPRYLTIYRAWLRDDFDFDAAQNNELTGGGWASYSVFQRLLY